jgi:hypothetical protein
VGGEAFDGLSGALLMKTVCRVAPGCRGDRLRRRIGSFARKVSAREAANYFKHAGYA